MKEQTVEDATIAGADSSTSCHLLVLGPSAHSHHALERGAEVVLGRSREADVYVGDPRVSRRHVRLVVGPPHRIEDLGSVNGTHAGDRALAPNQPVELGPGETVTIGDTVLVMREAGEDPGPRRLWTHEQLKARLVEECARQTRSQQPLAMLRIQLAGALQTAMLALGSALRPSDVLSLYVPGQYDIVLPDTDARGVEVIVDRLRRELGTSIGSLHMAAFPRDGRTSAELLEALSRPSEPPAREALRLPSPCMAEVYALVERVAGGTSSILIQGETGVGKDHVAQLIHDASPRRDRPLLRLNCAALSETLLESELFGHERGAFTGAVSSKRGLLETAAGGTVFLDEVGDMPASIQAKLLLVIERREILRVGGLRPVVIDVRFIAATNRDLATEMARQRFRSDLYYRLGAVRLHVAPLRERREDILPLARRFLSSAVERSGLQVTPQLSPETERLLEQYDWPGNVRELHNELERAVVFATGGEVRPEHLSFHARPYSRATLPPVTEPVRAVAPAGDEERKRRLVEVLEQCQGNQSRAAEVLGVSRRTLITWMEKYGLPRPRK